jgi:hypothetical protein
MSILVRRLIILAIGVLAGVAAWPLAELIVYDQGHFPSYLVFIPVLGAAVGAPMGAFFGAAEGITSRVKARILPGVLVGALVGLAGGAVGFLAGQAALLLIAEVAMRSYRSFQQVVLPVSRSIGWGFLGIFIGMVEGLRARSGKKTAVGILGGLVGGLAGGFVLEYLRLFVPGFRYTRLVGLVILGVAIAVLYAIVEKGLANGVLRVLNGALKGKEYLLTQSRLRIGRGRRNEIALAPYEGLAERQAEIRIRRGAATLVNLEPRVPVLVNEKPVREHRLKYDDVIKIGPVKLFYRVP